MLTFTRAPPLAFRLRVPTDAGCLPKVTGTPLRRISVVGDTYLRE
jgi:hypothetical protein